MLTVSKADIFKTEAWRMVLLGVMAMLGVLALAACGGEAATSTPAPQPQPQAQATVAADTSTTDSTSSGGASTAVSATLREWAIDLSRSEVSAGKITFTVTNQGMMQHNLTVMDASGNRIGATPDFGSSAGPQTLEVDLQPGTYTLICSLPGHAQRGQQAQLIVK